MKGAVTKVIDILTQEDFHGAFQKLLERYNKCIAARGEYFEGDKSFMRVLSIKVPILRKSGNLFNDPRTFVIKLIIVCVPFRKLAISLFYLLTTQIETKGNKLILFKYKPVIAVWNLSCLSTNCNLLFLV